MAARLPAHPPGHRGHILLKIAEHGGFYGQGTGNEDHSGPAEVFVESLMKLTDADFLKVAQVDLPVLRSVQAFLHVWQVAHVLFKHCAEDTQLGSGGPRLLVSQELHW